MIDERTFKAKFVSFCFKRKRNINSYSVMINTFEHNYIYNRYKLTMVKRITIPNNRSMYFCRENIHRDYKVKSSLCYFRELPWLNGSFLIREHKK